MAEYILRDQAIIAVTGAKLPDVSASGLPIANGKRSVTDCVRRLKEIPAAHVRPVVKGRWELDSDPGEPWRYVCNICGEKTKDTVMGKPRANLCPYCGADMTEES